MNITPWVGGKINTTGGLTAKEILTKGKAVHLGEVTGDFYAIVSYVDDGPDSQDHGTLIFVYNVKPEQIFRGGK